MTGKTPQTPDRPEDGVRVRIPNAIAWHRDRLKLRQRALAKRLGVAPWELNQVERGRALASERFVQLVAEALGVTPGDLYSQTALALIRDAEQIA